jgi:hypothetical protein
LVAKIVRLKSHPERVAREVVQEIEQQLRLFPEEQLPAAVSTQIRNTLRRFLRPDDKDSLWPGGFVMISKEQSVAVWRAIRGLPREKRPHQVMYAFNMILANLDQDTGEITLNRDQLVAELGCRPPEVSTIMGILESMGVIRRERQRIPGVPGPGMAVYFINPHIAWNGSLEIRKEEARTVEQPRLRLVDRG